MKNTTTVETEYLKSLEKQAKKLACLEAGGVDNWEFYDDSLEVFYREEEMEEALSSLVQNIIEDMYENVLQCVEEPSGRGGGYGLRKEGEENLRSILLQASQKILDIHKMDKKDD
jgi:hypothetical protein